MVLTNFVPTNANTKYYHGYNNKRRKDNEILMIEENKRRLKDANATKNETFMHFHIQFLHTGVRSYPTNVEFKKVD